MTQHRVVLLLLPQSASELESFSKGCHVWAVHSPENDSAARRVWDRLRLAGDDPLESGATLFESCEETPEDVCASIIEEIDQHHDIYSHDPALSAIEVHGASPTPVLRRKFREFGFKRCEKSVGFFTVYR